LTAAIHWPRRGCFEPQLGIVWRPGDRSLEQALAFVEAFRGDEGGGASNQLRIYWRVRHKRQPTCLEPLIGLRCGLWVYVHERRVADGVSEIVLEKPLYEFESTGIVEPL
jgi:hypothetical protein